MKISVTKLILGRCSRIVQVILYAEVIPLLDLFLGNNLKHAARRGWQI